LLDRQVAERINSEVLNEGLGVANLINKGPCDRSYENGGIVIVLESDYGSHCVALDKLHVVACLLVSLVEVRGEHD
jgi:hypothetical protein